MSDDVIWAVIGHDFCSYRVKVASSNFCRNEFNNTGLCNRTSCPLANARYATVREREGKLYLFMKTAERAHMPARLWERVLLSSNVSEALKQIDQNLIYWPHNTIQKCKQRFTRLKQYLNRSHKLDVKLKDEVLVPMKQKQKRRERTRERKALSAANLELAIEKELVARLKSGAYGENPINVSEDIWQKVLDENKEITEDVDGLSEEEFEKEDEVENYTEFVTDDEISDADDLEEDRNYAAVRNRGQRSYSEEDSDSQSSDANENIPPRNRKKSKKHIELEFEQNINKPQKLA